MRRYTNTRDGHNKFWEIEVDQVGDKWLARVRFGRIGSWGQERTKVFNYQTGAIRFMNEKINEKLGKGYKEAGKATVVKNVVNYQPDYVPVKAKPCAHNNLIASGKNKWKCKACDTEVDFSGSNVVPDGPSNTFEIATTVRRFFQVAT